MKILQFFANLKKAEKVKQDRFTTCFKTCGTGSLFWRVGRRCKVPLCQDLVGRQEWWCQMHNSGQNSFQNPTDNQTDRQTKLAALSVGTTVSLIFIV